MIKFGLFTDLHYGYTDYSSRKCTLGLNKLKITLEHMKDCDFIVNLGDIIDGTSDYKATNLLVDNINEHISGLNMINVIGNHDSFHLEKTKFSEVKDAEIGAVKVFEKEETAFIVLDFNFYTDGKPYDLTNGDWTNTYCPPKQLNWLKKQLAKSKNAVIFTHQSLLSSGCDNPESYDDLHIVKNAEEVRNILEHSGKVKYVFSGHNHNRAFACYNGINYYTLPAMCEYDDVPFIIARLNDENLSLSIMKAKVDSDKELVN
ncbi:metallophosphoesterase [Eubacteriales bacterium OttesenSCG-928-G02]|nr:metallophosphoesterase [Eubacteriales bacterium OttesenSCG-928-G02]